ncbi:hypothetical protein MRB53_026360 [Persea americana]|uniref:Uncharacterized protein n=1 Tax=Persea americana TaxID=3435 RepID=A0ACC2LHZ4_PERAE|nr:hypothetical protein MRB53_026360 [Persea americana]
MSKSLLHLLNDKRWHVTLAPKGPLNSSPPVEAPLPLRSLLSDFPSFGKRKVDLPLPVFHGVAKVHTTSHNAALPFPGVISKLLVDMGKLAEPNEDIIIPKQKIDHFTLDKSKSHITSVELGDDDEGDTTGPSGTGPSGVGPSIVADLDAGMSRDDQMGEVAIHALNERIRHLEVRVDEGFAEIRQSLAEILDRLRSD